MGARVNGENDRVVQSKPQLTLRSMEESPRKSTLFTVSTRWTKIYHEIILSYLDTFSDLKMSARVDSTI